MADANAYRQVRGFAAPVPDDAPEMKGFAAPPPVPVHRDFSVAPKGDGPIAGFWPDYRDKGNEVVQRGTFLPGAKYQDGKIHPAWPSVIDSVVQGLATAATSDPRDNSKEANDRLSHAAFDVGGMAATGGMAVPRPANSIGTFGGRLAKNANREALAKAEAGEAAGLPREQIWQDHGWFRGADGKWRFEIDDRGLRVRNGQGRDATNPISHPELMSGYPDLKDLNSLVLGHRTVPSASGSYTRALPSTGQEVLTATAPTLSEARSVAAHELQHAVQQREGFASGGSAGEFLPGGPRATWVSPSNGQPRPLTANETVDHYLRLAGEIEARNVQTRLNMTPAERRKAPPWETEDMRPDWAIK